MVLIALRTLEMTLDIMPTLSLTPPYLLLCETN